MTCPDCRAVVKDAPAPAYTVREITQKFIQHAELLPEGETTEQHEENRAQETAILEADRSKPEVGLFNGRFRITIGWNGELRPRMRDEEDGVERCPHCFWELERGDGAICPRCGEAHDPGSDVTYESDGSNMTGSSYDESHMVHFHHAHHVHDHDHHHHHHHEHDEDLDEDDDMYDHEGFAGLDPHVGLEDLYEDGGEAYYISSDNEEDQGVRIRRAQAPPHRMPPIGRPQGREQTPIHIGSDSEGSSTAEFSPRISGNSPRRPPVRARRTVYSDEDDEEEDDESIGSMEDFLDDEEDLESGSSSTSSGSSGDELSDDDNIHSGPAPARAPITISIDEEDGSSSGRSQESDSDPLPDITQQQRRAYQEAMNRHAPRGGRRVRPWEAQPQSIRQARQAQQAVEVSDDEDSGGQGSSQAHEDELSSGGDENSSAGEEEEDDEDDPPVYSISRYVASDLRMLKYQRCTGDAQTDTVVSSSGHLPRKPDVLERTSRTLSNMQRLVGWNGMIHEAIYPLQHLHRHSMGVTKYP